VPVRSQTTSTEAQNFTPTTTNRHYDRRMRRDATEILIKITNDRLISAGDLYFDRGINHGRTTTSQRLSVHSTTVLNIYCIVFNSDARFTRIQKYCDVVSDGFRYGNAVFTPDTCSPDTSCIHLYPLVSAIVEHCLVKVR